jgi:CheY-like chemotaxis protein
MILFVDDKRTFLDAIVRHLASVGFDDVLVATSADEALEMVEENEDIRHIVCDLRMPGAGALPFLERARGINAALGCTLLTGFPEDLSIEDWATAARLQIEVVGKADLTPDWLTVLADRLSRDAATASGSANRPDSSSMMPTDSTRAYDVFLSYNSKDVTAAVALAERLRDAGIRVWIDAWALVPGRSWQEALESMIEQTRTAAVLVGPSGLGPWEIPEMRACLSECVSRSMPVIPVLLPGTQDCPVLPLFLRQFTWVDMRGGITPRCIERMVWGITGMRPEPR